MMGEKEKKRELLHLCISEVLSRTTFFSLSHTHLTPACRDASIALSGFLFLFPFFLSPSAEVSMGMKGELHAVLFLKR